MTSRKKTGIIAGVGVGAAAAATLRRRWSGGREAGEVPTTAVAPAADGTAFLEHLAAAVRIPTMSSEDGFDPEPFTQFAAFLAQTYPLVHRSLHLEVVGGHTLFFTWEGSDPTTSPILLMAHQDVVPVEEGTEDDWEKPPFSGEVADGFLWGRGTLDDKGSLIAILEAVEALLGEGFTPASTVHLLFGHDEEVGGARGAAVVAEMLGERGVRLRFVLDEGGAVVSDLMPGVPPLGLIGIGEKASLDLEISASGEGGHSSMPPPHTAVGRVAAAVKAIEDNPMPTRLGPQREFFEVLASVSRGPRRWMLSRLEITGKLIERLLTRSHETNALIRTTAAATVIRGGVKSNVLPQEASAIVNFRILPGDTATGVIDHVRSVVGDEVRVRAIDFGKSSDPAPPSSTDTEGFHLIASTVGEVFPRATPTPWILLGATDSRYFTPIADGVYRFAPFQVTTEDLGRVHGTGERVRVADAAAAVSFYRTLLIRAGGRS